MLLLLAAEITMIDATILMRMFTVTEVDVVMEELALIMSLYTQAV